MSDYNLPKKANTIFYQIIGIGISFFAVLIFLGIRLYPQLLLVKQSLLNKLESICGCTNHFTFASHPFIFISFIGLGLAFLGFLSFIIFRVMKLRNSTNKFIKSNLKNKKQNISPKLKKVAQQLELENQIIEVNDEKPVIFCFGIIRPQICVSSGLIRRLQKKELIAVLLHEQHHLVVREPMKLFVIKLIDKILFFGPGLSALSKKYLTYSELSADQQATNNFQDKVPLAQSLCKIIKWEERLAIKDNLALPFFGAVVEERVNKLADNNYTPKFKVLTAKLGIGIFVILLSVFFLNILFASSQSVMLDHDSAMCHQAKSNPADQCQMMDEASCTMSYSLESHNCDDMS